MAVKVEPVAGGKHVVIRVAKGTETYDATDGLLYEESEALDVKELGARIDAAVKAGKKIKDVEEE